MITPAALGPLVPRGYIEVFVTDRISKAHRSWNMSRVRSENTKPEKLLRSMLHRAGFRFRINVRDLPGKPDIVLRKYRVVIFVDGCFWHRHDGCKKASMPSTRQSFWKEKFQKTVERDKRQAEQLEKSGWKVIRVWECELENNAEQSVERIARYLRTLRHE